MLESTKQKLVKEGLWWKKKSINKSVSKDNDFSYLPINTFIMCRNKTWKTGKKYSKHKILSKLES